MIKTIILLIFGMSQAAYGQEETCVVGQSYVPPATARQPHIIKTQSVDVVLWPSAVHLLEILPWNLVCKKMCFNTSEIKINTKSKEVVVNSREDIRIMWKNSCN